MPERKAAGREFGDENTGMCARMRMLFLIDGRNIPGVKFIMRIK